MCYSNFSKLNWFLGVGAAKDGRQSRYPEIDFCKDPEIICSSSEYKELEWIAGMFYWIESVQGYSVEGWDYLTELQSFVESGMTDTGFIDGVSGIVNRGCYNPVSCVPCAVYELSVRIIAIIFANKLVLPTTCLCNSPAAPEHLTVV